MSSNTLGHRIKPAIVTGLTATGSSQATAYPLTNNSAHEFTTTAASTGAVLPFGVTPSEVSIFNAGASTLTVYPPLGGAIDGGSANAGVSVATLTGATFWAASPTAWHSLVTAGPGGGGGSGTVTSASVVSAHGFAGSVATATTTPAITLTTSVTGVLKGNGTAISAAAAGTDYYAPGGAIAASDLPHPSASTLGGVESIVAVAHNFLTSISTSGVPAQAQPAFTDISGTATGAQLPNPSASTLGGVQSAAAVTHQWITSISTSGVPALSQPAFTDISGTATGAQLPNPSASTLGGVQSAAAVTHQWITSISTSGVPALSQPAFTDISGTATAAQLPTTGLVITQSSHAIAAPADGATINFDLSTSNFFAPAALAGNRALTLSNAPASTPWASPFTVILLQDATGSRTITSWFSGFTVLWAGGSAPTLTTTASKRDTFAFIQIAATTLLGFVVGQNS